ncbi:unnamed protein product [Owenia fusiformis]|uniref:MIF4G domain-containing protein n=1 Tax=Owenia fusiformis TaxID=6347 RepID=A0A8S4P4T3_OWEFU|nr:unnamed protein product [Owenia fusiformis]
MAGRGRGRGALLLKELRRPGEPGKAQPTPTSDFTEQEKPCEDLDDLLSKMRLDDESYIKSVIDTAKLLATSDENIEQMSKTIHEHTTEHPMFGMLGASISQGLVKTDFGQKYRANMLKLIQADFKNKGKLRSQSIVRFSGGVSYLCSVFNTLRSATGEPFKPLVIPVFDCLEMLLYETAKDVEITLCYTQLKKMGFLLEECNPERMQALLNLIRIKIIESSTTEKARCQLMEIVELRANRWQDIPIEERKIYIDTLEEISNMENSVTNNIQHYVVIARNTG